MATIRIPEKFKPLFTPGPRYIGFRGGRGSGKSHNVASALVTLAASRKLRIVCAREVQNSIKESVKQLLDDKIAAAGLDEFHGNGFFQSLETEIRGRNGSAFLFAGLRKASAQNIKSLEGADIAWVEEAAYVSQSSFDVLTPTIRKPGSRLVFTWNPRSEKDPVDKFFRENAGDASVLEVPVNWDDNPWFPDELRIDMERDRRRDPDKYAHIWLGHYQKNSEARVFKNWRVEAFETPADARFYFGADWGFSVDPTVLVRCWIKDRTLYIDKEAYKVGCEIDNTPALFRTIPGSDKWPIRADSARPETISYMQRNGFPQVVAANKGAGSVEDGIEFLKSYDIVVHPDCKHTIDELTLYSYKVDKLTGEVLPVLEDKENHVIDALRYAVELVRVPKVSTSVTPLRL